eukprot:11191992-Lingulodinium_polyedra.AAC.1
MAACAPAMTLRAHGCAACWEQTAIACLGGFICSSMSLTVGPSPSASKSVDTGENALRAAPPACGMPQRRHA